MNTKILFVAAALVVGTPLAVADQTAPDCEENQPWIGYGTTADLVTTYNNLGAPGGARTCEGEHWDGQDTVGSQSTTTTNCAAGPQVSASGVAWCMNADPNEGSADPTQGATPLGLRVSTGEGAYAGANIFSVGRAAVYTDGEHTFSVYLRDNTPGNVLATVISAARITKGHVDENDCSQEEYQTGAETNDPDMCGRENTAITIILLS